MNVIKKIKSKNLKTSQIAAQNGGISYTEPIGDSKTITQNSTYSKEEPVLQPVIKSSDRLGSIDIDDATVSEYFQRK